jgi:hypothetical protein
VKDALEELGRRIERVALDPDAIESQALFRVARPLFALTGWRARVSYGALEALVRTMRDARGADDGPKVLAAVQAATRELEANVVTVERAAIVRKRPPVAHAAWLRRAWELVVLASRATDAMFDGGAAPKALAGVTLPDRAAILPPLALRTKAHDDGELVTEVPTRESLPETEAEGRIGRRAGSTPALPPFESVVELELAAIDRLLDAARAERSVLARKRRLLVAARQRLLEASAALPIEPAGTRARADYLAREIARIDRFEHAGVSVDAGLVHQARLAVTRGDPRLAYAALAALEGAALAGGDARVAAVASRAIGKMCPGGDPRSAEVREASLQRSAMELLGADVVNDVAGAIDQARAAASARKRTAATATAIGECETAEAHFGPTAANEIARASIAVDGCFEVGGALAPMRVEDEERVLREVRFPTPHLLLVPARDVEDLPDAIVSDPRAILLDLAAGRLLSRRFVQDETRPTSRVVMRSEVRVYVVDGSGSMSGPRARVRDALLVAELSTMIARLRAPKAVRCTLYYRFFNDDLGPVTRVDSVAAARAAIRDVAGVITPAGRTSSSRSSRASARSRRRAPSTRIWRGPRSSSSPTARPRSTRRRSSRPAPRSPGSRSASA